MKRRINIDKLRAMACLLVVVYHAYVISGRPSLGIQAVKDVISYGGEIGVTAFFMLSGYGIFCSLRIMEQNGNMTFANFIKKRIKVIVPHYYFNLAVVLLISSSVIYIDQIKNIVAHLLFVHSFDFSWYGAFNGVLWTMAVTFHFYLLAIPLYKIVSKYPVIAALISIILSVVLKYLTLNYWWVVEEEIYGTYAYVIPGRQIWTCLDNFVIGMVVARLIETKNKEIKLSPIFGYAGLCICLWLLVRLGKQFDDVYGVKWTNCSWHSLLAVVLGIYLFFFGIIQQREKSLVSRFWIRLSRYSYGIYLWHLLIIRNLFENRGEFKAAMANGNVWLVICSLTLISVLFGIACSWLIDCRKRE